MAGSEFYGHPIFDMHWSMVFLLYFLSDTEIMFDIKLYVYRLVYNSDSVYHTFVLLQTVIVLTEL